MRLPGLGNVRLVVSVKHVEWTGTSAVVVTHRVDGHAPRIITRALQRWPMETFDQDGQGHLGVDTSRRRNAAALGKHGCLVFVAYALLHLDCLPPSPAKGNLPLKTIGDACRQQAHALRQAFILSAHAQLQRGQQAVDLLATFFAKPQTAMAR